MKIKNISAKDCLFIAVIIALLFFCYLGFDAIRIYSRSIEPSSFRSFSVSGDGKVVAVPDVASFSFSVITEGGIDLSALQKENIEKMNKAIGFLKENGAEEKDIKTESYYVSPRYKNYICPRESDTCLPPEIIGYTITQSVAVKIRDFSKIGSLLSGVVKKGANSVFNFSFTIDDPEKIKAEARALAVSKAIAKAEALAEAGGFKAGRLLSIQEGGNDYWRAAGMGVSVKEAVADIQPGSQDVEITMTLTYEIK